MANTELIRPKLVATVDGDDDGLDSTLNNIRNYYAYDYPVITPRIIKSLSVLLGYLDGTNSSDSSKWKSYAASLTTSLQKQYLKYNPNWLWDPFSLEDGNTDTEAKKQADAAMTGKIYHSSDTTSKTAPYVILSQDNGLYTANVIEGDSAANYANTITTDMSAKLVSTTTTNGVTTSVVTLT